MLLAACGSQGGTDRELRADVARQTVSLEQASSIPSVVRAGDQLGLDLIRAAGPDNVVTSPASAQLALSMAAEGADGQTLAELEDVLGAQGRAGRTRSTR